MPRYTTTRTETHPRGYGQPDSEVSVTELNLLAIAANMKVLNDSISTEINAAKMAIQAKKEGFEFGRNVEMGKRLIG